MMMSGIGGPAFFEHDYTNWTHSLSIIACITWLFMSNVRNADLLRNCIYNDISFWSVPPFIF